MDLDQLAQIVDDMAVQHEYPGYDIRSLKMGLPPIVIQSPSKLFCAALKHENVLVRLVGLRWFWEKPGVAKPYHQAIGACLFDVDPWVRREAVRCLERLGKVEPKLAEQVAQLLSDEDVEVRKHAAKALGKIGIRSDELIARLQRATEDADHEVRWKAQKALRQLGAYVA